jgi:hypothetical protein
MSITTAVICICVSIIFAGILASPKTQESDFRLKEIGDRLFSLENRLKELSDRIHFSQEHIGASLAAILEELRKTRDR